MRKIPNYKDIFPIVFKIIILLVVLTVMVGTLCFPIIMANLFFREIVTFQECLISILTYSSFAGVMFLFIISQDIGKVARAVKFIARRSS